MCMDRSPLVLWHVTNNYIRDLSVRVVVHTLESVCFRNNSGSAAVCCLCKCMQLATPWSGLDR